MLYVVYEFLDSNGDNGMACIEVQREVPVKMVDLLSLREHIIDTKDHVGIVILSWKWLEDY